MSGLSAVISVKLKLGQDSYNVDLNIPSATPTPEAPFLFSVVSPEKGEQPANTLLEVAIGNANHIYVAVAPPSSLLKETGVDKVVENLNVVVSEGKYNKTDKKFDQDKNEDKGKDQDKNK
ncbi:hypothetical protein C6H64_21195 [Photorhabdus luminescens]|uniref:Uncharacterized protein n=1 Tax=Photorhabdus aegyptia TaxID=2805098 RepID=A0A022PFP8_9GAMM|nr:MULTISPECIES: hypothetical protein [Photorhabdus]PQQ24479.1 hypothetical protein C6H64_21195 [Photorhabdus luminescens]EYU14369.1 hypothetical protein BA1DRAFT_03114 [Photorhabdus aegyptia]MBS9430810.1 hypothetical protein [Photorhabdus akhurstii]MBS9434982.1 hypothetical protein [Photorhabdus hainanensis]PQQ25673.1 hypothetical protein C6H69_22130 [Photorhabdus luminescens]